MAVGKLTREELVVILASDSAVDCETDEGRAAFDRYTAAGFDEKLLQWSANGEKPTRFTLRRLNYDARKHADELRARSDVEAIDFIVRASLRRIDNYELRHDDGITKLEQPELEDHKTFGRLIKLEWMRKASLPAEHLNVLAALARLLSEGDVPFAGSLPTAATASESAEQSSPAKRPTS